MSRLLCTHCERPLATCLCSLVQAVLNRVQVLILQHPAEQHQAKGTARLLQLGLQRCELRVGERFMPEPDSDGRYSLLLYPDIAKGPRLLAPPPLDQSKLDHPEQLRLIVLDGTWRKSRKLLYLNHWLQTLPRLPLQDLPAPSYRIRRAHAGYQLSTLEAVACALQQLEGEPVRWLPLWHSLQAFVARELDRRPE